MKTYRYCAILLAIGILAGLLADQFSEAQTVNLTPDVRLDTNQVIIVVIIGGVAGVIRAWQGYDKSPKDFDTVRFIHGVREAVLISIPLALSSALLMELNAYGYVMVFFAVVGGASLTSNSRRPSIPANATDEEIKKLLG